MEKVQILVVDDESQMRLAIEAVLLRLGHTVVTCSCVSQALGVLSNSKIDLIISDMKMPEVTGLELLAQCRSSYQQIPFVLITAYGTIGQAVEAMKNGAFDFITKPFSAEDLSSVVARALRPERATMVAPRSVRKERSEGMAIVSNDAGFKRTLEIACTVAQSSASVLIQGESGTGKELIAKLIHQSSPRVDAPFVAVNCAAVPAELLESELFGHEKGSFTGATATRIGKFEQAQGGTILLDEISEMDELLQAKLLRVLQEREVDRVGGSRPISIDVRVLATTNRDIRASVAKGEFREDLFYRLNVIPLSVPPLRDRKGDIKLLVEFFVRRFSKGVPKAIPAEVMQRLEEYSWPGNVRELQNACERAVILSPGETLEIEPFLLGSGLASSRRETDIVTNDHLRLKSGLSVSDAERLLILETLRSTQNNRTKAAELLGISIRTLRNKLHEYGLSESALGGEL